MPNCPECGKPLEPVEQASHGMLNADQFNSVRAGDWFCDTCPGDRGHTGYRYFWKSELEMPGLGPSAAPATDPHDLVAREIVIGLMGRAQEADLLGVHDTFETVFPGVAKILRRKYGAGREPFAEGRDHLTTGKKFQSNKYWWCPADFVPLKITDPAARDLLAEYALRREAIDVEFPRDLLEALDNVPAKPNPRYKPFQTIASLKAKLAKALEALLHIREGECGCLPGLVGHNAMCYRNMAREAIKDIGDE